MSVAPLLAGLPSTLPSRSQSRRAFVPPYTLNASMNELTVLMFWPATEASGVNGM